MLRNKMHMTYLRLIETCRIGFILPAVQVNNSSELFFLLGKVLNTGLEARYSHGQLTSEVI